MAPSTPPSYTHAHTQELITHEQTGAISTSSALQKIYIGIFITTFVALFFGIPPAYRAFRNWRERRTAAAAETEKFFSPAMYFTPPRIAIPPQSMASYGIYGPGRISGDEYRSPAAPGYGGNNTDSLRSSLP